MLVLLPPSETKTPGGRGAHLDTSRLSYPSLEAARIRAQLALTNLLDQGDDYAAVALKLGKSQRGELEVNRELLSSGTMAVIERYTGVLFDALDFDSLSLPARQWIFKNVAVQNALFGLLRADDQIPNYRLAPNSKLPGLESLNKHWSSVLTSELSHQKNELIVDLRSSVYVKMGPLPSNKESLSIRPVQKQADGTVKALNHFNKAAKGRLLRNLAIHDSYAVTGADLIALLHDLGYETILTGPGAIDLIES